MKTDSFCALQNAIEFCRQSADPSPTFDLALHTAKPVGDKQSSKEVSAEGYSRVTVGRTVASWKVTGRVVTNASLIRFPTITKGSASATYLSIGIAGKIRRLVKLSEPIELRANRRAEFEPGTIEIVDVGDE